LDKFEARSVDGIFFGYCDRTAQINSILLPKPLHLDIKQ
jgi:hypothetical protein